MASAYDDDDVPDSIKQLIDAAFDAVLDDHPPSGSLPLQTHIPFSLIPAALARLNLAPDDEDVLQVFRNAASGWARPQSMSLQTEGVVSRKDFRAVCAVLLDAESAPSYSGAPIPEGGGFIIEDENEGGGFIPPTTSTSAAASDHFDSGDDDSDVYQDSDSSEDEYIEGSSPSKSKRSSKRRTKSYDSDEDMVDSPHLHAKKPLSPKQKKESRLAFGLFFPDVGDDKLDEQRIMMRDIIRVAGLLKEKIKAEEVCIYLFLSVLLLILFVIDNGDVSCVLYGPGYVDVSR